MLQLYSIKRTTNILKKNTKESYLPAIMALHTSYGILQKCFVQFRYASFTATVQQT